MIKLLGIVVLCVWAVIGSRLPSSHHHRRFISQVCPFPRDYVKPFVNVDPNHPFIKSALTQAIDIFNTALNQSELTRSAMSMAIVFNQTVLWSGGVGTTDYTKPNAPPPNGDSIYKIASQTKVFTTFMLLKLRDAGLLSLEDSALKKFPKFSLRSDPFGTNSHITLRNLASQLSGLPRESPCGLGNMPTADCMANSNVWSLISKVVDPIWPPGELPSYSNLGFSILGRGLEGLVNTPYEDWIEKNILQPIGMTSSGFNITTQIADRIPTIPGTGKMQWTKITNLGWSNPAGQMYSTVNDIAKFMMNLFHKSDERVFLRSTVGESLTPQWNDFSGVQGFGLPYEMIYLDDLWVMTKGGSLPGHNSISLYVKELKLGVTMSTSTPPDITPPLEAADSIIVLLAEALKAAIAETQNTFIYPAPPDLIKNFVGCYVGSIFGENETLQITQNQMGELQLLGTLDLYYREHLANNYIFQIGMMLNECYVDEVEAYEGQYIYFQLVGNNYQIQLPTLLGMNAPFIKQPCS